MANNEIMQSSSFPDLDSPLERRVVKFAKVLLYIGMCNALIMMILTITHAISRYAFDEPLLALASVSAMLLATMIFAVGSYTQAVKGHVVVGIFVDRLSERKQAIIDSFTYIICLMIVALAFWQSVLQAVQMMSTTATTQAFVPLFAVYFFIALGWGAFSMMLILQLRHIFRRALGRRKS